MRLTAALVLGTLMFIATPCLAWEIESKMEIGALSFDENVFLTTTVETQAAVSTLVEEQKLDFNDNLYYTRFEITAGDYDFTDLEGGLEFGAWLTETDNSVVISTLTATAFDLRGQTLVNKRRQVEDLGDYLHGYDFHAELGWGGAIGEESLRWAAFMGYGYKKTKIDRIVPIDSQLATLTRAPAVSLADHLYDIHYIDFTGRLMLDITDDIAFLLEPSIGPVVASTWTSDLAGTIKGTGGLILKLQGMGVWNVKENIKVEAGAFYDLQWLEGGGRAILLETDPAIDTHSHVRWDNHVTEVFGASIGIDFLF